MCRRTVFAALVLTLFAPAAAPAQEPDADAREIQRVVEQAYVQGIHVQRSPELVRAGFHPDFVMKVRTEDGVVSVTRDEWIERLQAGGEPEEREVRSDFERVDVTGRTAVTKLRLFIDGEHRFTDYLSLYRLGGEWKIVAKVFEAHR